MFYFHTVTTYTSVCVCVCSTHLLLLEVVNKEIAAFYLITPRQQQDLHAGIFSRRGNFDNNGLHHDCSIGEVLDGVTLQHAKDRQRAAASTHRPV